MPYKFIAVAEESTYRTPGTPNIYLKLLNESLNTTREDFYPETTQYWVAGKRAEGFFRTSGSFDTLVEPVMWPKLLVLMVGDPTSTGTADGYTHVWKFGGNETIGTTGIKPFTTTVGVGIEKDRQLTGCVLNSLSLEAVNKEVLGSTVGILGSGEENLVAAATPTYAPYTVPYLSFAECTAFSVGSHDCLADAPTVEAFRLNLNRSLDADHYVLGNRYLGDLSLGGMSTVGGTIDFGFLDQQEHERFLSAVGSFSTGDQASFAISATFTTSVLHIGGGTTHYSIKVDIPEAHYTSSTASVSARDRIVQTVNWMGMYNASDASAAKITAVNATASYVSLS